MDFLICIFYISNQGYAESGIFRRLNDENLTRDTLPGVAFVQGLQGLFWMCLDGVMYFVILPLRLAVF